MNYPDSYDAPSKPTPSTIRSSTGGISPANLISELIEIVKLLEATVGLRAAVAFTADHSTNTFTATGHGMSDGDVVIVQTTGTLPTGLAALTRYFVVNKTSNTFQLGATSGGSAIDISANGTGTHSFVVLIGIGKALVGAAGGRAGYSTTMPASGLVAGTTDVQELSNKTLVTPIIASFANATHTHANQSGGGQLGISALTAAAQQSLVPTGALFPYGGASAPSGYVLCNGAALSRTDYSALFAILGTTYGVGDGSTTFNVPDLRQRLPFGKASSGVGVNLGETGGALTHSHWQTVGADPSFAYIRTQGGGLGTKVETTTRTLIGAVSSGNDLGRFDKTETESSMAPYLVFNFIIKT